MFSAIQDLFYFGVIFFCLVLGFSLVIIMNYGIELVEFKHMVGGVFFNTMQLNGYEMYDQLEDCSTAIQATYVIYVAFSLSMNLMLINLFIAILDGYYQENNKTQVDRHIFHNVTNHLKAQYFQILEDEK